MKKLFCIIFLISFNSIYTQVTGYQENYDDGDISSWYVGDEHQRTFQLSVINNALNINYTRISSSWEWDNFHFSPPHKIDVNTKPLASIKIRSTVNTVLTFKPNYENGSDDWIQKSLIGDNVWRTLNFEMNPEEDLIIDQIYFYLDGGTTLLKEGVVQFDDFCIGDSAIISAELYQLEDAISKTEALLVNTTEGSEEDEFPVGSKASLESALNIAELTLSSDSDDQSIFDQAVWDLYDACVDYEKSVNASETNLIDSTPTKETRYLYQNMVKLSNNFLLFGMQDATGYGVGWSGDDDRSDVKDVCGDFPAVYSEEMRKITRGMEYDRLKYRITSAYERGGIATMCWHQYDPKERGFYQEDVNYERVVETILPGGEYHNAYKNKLKIIALFFKSLRSINGESIPVIFRPFHEHTGDWFWWGPAHCSTEEFNSIWQFTTHYLQDSLNVHNLIWAISPSFQHVGVNDQYFDIYPGDNYVDIFGGDKYFHTNPVPQDELEAFNAKLQNIAGHSKSRNKIPAMTEVSNTNITVPNWFTDILLESIKTDESTMFYSYAAVWRNESVTHHHAPYTGHSIVPDFMDFYEDPFTLFEEDLPDMYLKPVEDILPPVIISSHDTTLISSTTDVSISIQTNERAFLRYGYIDQSYDEMAYDFEIGQGRFNHETTISGIQDEVKTIYIQVCDVWGNKSEESLEMTFVVDTMQTLVKWTDIRYPLTNWSVGTAPLGSGTNINTQVQNVRTIYFRKVINFSENPSTLAILLKSQGGAVIYVNNYEISRINMPAEGEINFDTSPTTNVSLNKIITLTTEELEYFTSGNNVIAIETHMPEGSAIESFDARIFGQTGIISPLGSEWTYFDSGNEPGLVKLRDILTSTEKEPISVEFYLHQNFPNPFNPTTTIQYEINKKSNVHLIIYNMKGQIVQELINSQQKPGLYSVNWDASKFSSGLYLYHLIVGNYTQIKKCILLK